MEKDPVTDSKLQIFQGLQARYATLMEMRVCGLTELEVWFNRLNALMEDVKKAGHFFPEIMGSAK